MPDTPLVLPLDAHNQRLVDNVHPASWENPRPAEVYHLVLLGAGTAGLVAAARAGSGGEASAPRFGVLGVDVLLGEGRFCGPDALEVQGRKLRFRRALVA